MPNRSRVIWTQIGTRLMSSAASWLMTAMIDRSGSIRSANNGNAGRQLACRRREILAAGRVPTFNPDSRRNPIDLLVTDAGLPVA